jgi:hypothetical protein
VGHAIECVAEGNDPRPDRDEVAAETVGIAAAVPALVMMPDDRGESARQGERSADSFADHRMAPHDRPLVIGKLARFRQDRLGDSDLADVVQERPVGERL